MTISKLNGIIPKQKLKVGVLLVNIGTPSATDYFSMRRYLAEFLTDRRVIEMTPWLWYPILYGMILLTRPQKSGALYQEIWNRELDESPLRTITRSQAVKLQKKFNDDVIVRWAFRYGEPSISSVIDDLIESNCDKLLAFALYPQYSATTIGSVYDKTFEALMKKRKVPSIRTVPSYETDPAYIEALAKSVESHLKMLNFKPEILLTSYHGIPQSYADAGDPYPEQCHATTRNLQKRLGDLEVITTFQSRFGPNPWLMPYTDEMVAKLAKNGTKSIAVITPGFVADCLETSHEIGMDAAELFLENGGENFTHVPSLNDSDIHIELLEKIVRRELGGWIENKE